MLRPRTALHAIAPLLLLFAAPAALARFRAPDSVPVDRLVKNVSGWVEAHPNDAHGHYVLARVHTLALVHKSETVRVYLDRRDPDGKLPTVDVPYGTPDPGPPPPRETLVEHLEQALAHTARAIELAPDEAAYHLARAYAAEAGALFPEVEPPREGGEAETSPEEDAQIAAWAKDLDAEEAETREAATRHLEAFGARAWRLVTAAVANASPEARGRLVQVIVAWWREAALAEYLRAFDLAIEGDLALPSLPLRGLAELVAHEAGTAWLRLAKVRGVRPEEEATLERVGAGVKQLKEKRRTRITPIVLPLGEANELDDLLPAARSASFDLDGDGLVEQWPWLAPDAALLVWDPTHRGHITSGRQLFGSVTWWMFFRDGYEALAALDDDGDGWLEGAELEGLALWQDRDGDGVSDPGEVRSVEDHGIAALATRAARDASGVLHAAAGARFADGHTRPTYDWTPTSR